MDEQKIWYRRIETNRGARPFLGSIPCGNWEHLVVRQS